MADDSDEERPKRIIDNQHYDELLEVPDAEDVASICTPTPRTAKHSAFQQNQNRQDKNNQNHNSKFSSNIDPSLYSITEDENPPNRPRPAERHIRMNSDREDSPQHPMQEDQNMDDNSDDNESTDNEGSRDNNQYNENMNGAGGYDPSAYRDLPASPEIKDVFKFIERYQPQNIELDFKLRPFIPDYIPSIGDIDAFITVPRPDNKPDNLGLTVVDEPSSNQSDPHVLDLFFRTLSKQNVDVAQPTTVKMVESNNTKAIDSWIKNISALQKNKPIQSVNYKRAMPSIEQSMQIWPQEYEDLLKEVSLPSCELNVDLKTYVDIICALLDIPVYENSRLHSAHLLFSLYSEFKNSQHFKNPNQTMNLYASTAYKGNWSSYAGAAKEGKNNADRLVIE